MKLFLNTDVRGLCSGKLYGKSGDAVTLIADHWDMLIVEGSCERFPVRKEAVSEALVESPKTLEVNPVHSKEPPQVKRPLSRKTRKVKQQNPQKLF